MIPKGYEKRSSDFHLNKLHVQFGCGSCAPKGWLNFDSSPTLRFERIPIIGSLYTRNSQRWPANVRYGDIVKGLPISQSSCSGIYSSHVLEHLALQECEVALQHAFSYLEPGGTFRCLVPDLRAQIDAYLADSPDVAALRFMEYTGLGRKTRERGVRGFVKEWFGNSHHLWLWDERSLTDAMKAAGFKHVRRAKFNDSEDRRFIEVESLERFDYALALECIK